MVKTQHMTVAQQTILEYPSLFKIVTPIDVDCFEKLLSDQSNPLFVNSVWIGLRKGFWPWANIKEGYPTTYDGARPTPLDEKRAKFICEQCDIKISKGCFSQSFGHDLLLGMYCMPVHAVPKPNSSDLHIVTDHSLAIFL